MQAKKIVILGSTGSLGKQTLEIVKQRKGDFQIVGLSADISVDELKRQARQFKVQNIVLAARDGAKALNRLAALKEADIIINVLSGVAGIEPSIAALQAGKILLLGNKESLVAEGEKIMKLAKNRLIPLDSEHNAIYEILKKYPDQKIKKIILPCSGGPFLGKSRKELEKVTARDALRHPKWNMGAKISIESATFINKGLEIIEAHRLFHLPINKIEVKIHPECIIHGIVQFGRKTIGYFAEPDMKEHIENALLRAINLPLPKRKIQPVELKELNLHDPDEIINNSIGLVLNSRNHRKFLEKEETILKRFLDGELEFPDIFKLLRHS